MISASEIVIKVSIPENIRSHQRVSSTSSFSSAPLCCRFTLFGHQLSCSKSLRVAADLIEETWGELKRSFEIIVRVLKISS